MNSIRNGLGMRKAGDHGGPGQPEKSHSYAVFTQVSYLGECGSKMAIFRAALCVINTTDLVQIKFSESYGMVGVRGHA